MLVAFDSFKKKNVNHRIFVIFSSQKLAIEILSYRVSIRSDLESR